MFKRLAKIRQFEPRHLVPYRLLPVHSNDNQPSRRHRAGRRRSAKPALTCRWSLLDAARLECRWDLDSFDEPGRPGSAREGEESDARRI
jgi:hypothetical protein